MKNTAPSLSEADNKPRRAEAPESGRALHKRSWIVPILLGLLCFFIIAAFTMTKSGHNYFERRSYDWRVALRNREIFRKIQAPTHYRNPDVVVVPIDNKTLDDVKEPAFFWVPYFSMVFNSLIDNGAKVVALDYQFQISPDKYLKDQIDKVLSAWIKGEGIKADPDSIASYLPNNELKMFLALRKRKVILMTFLTEAGKVSKPFLPFALAAGASGEDKNLGLVNTQPDEDGTARRQFLYKTVEEENRRENYYIMMLLTAKKYLGGSLGYYLSWHIEPKDVLSFTGMADRLAEPAFGLILSRLDEDCRNLIKNRKPADPLNEDEKQLLLEGINRLIDNGTLFDKSPMMDCEPPTEEQILNRYPGARNPETRRKMNREILNYAFSGIIAPVSKDALRNRFTLAGKKIPTDDDYSIIINYIGPPGTFTSDYSFSELVKRAQAGDNEYFRKNFSGKAVLIGPGYFGSTDLVVTPFNTFTTKEMYGIEVHANILNTILNEDYITTLPLKSNLAILLFVSLISCIICYSFRPLGAAVLSAAVAAVIVGASFYVLYRYNVWMHMINPLAVIPLSFATVYSYRYLAEDRERKYIRQILGRYISESVAMEILKDPSKLALGGKRGDATILFCDINDFTTFSEKTSPEEVIAILNDYFTRMEKVVFENRCTLKQFVGDEIMVISGAPQPDPDHAFLVCKTGIEMVRELLRWQEERKKEGKFIFDVKFGIHSGPVVAGNVGSPHRTEYTTVGDVVNTASRIMGLTKKVGARILISEETYKLVKDRVTVQDKGVFPVKGKEQQVRVYELTDLLRPES